MINSVRLIVFVVLREDVAEAGNLVENRNAAAGSVLWCR